MSITEDRAHMLRRKFYVASVHLGVIKIGINMKNVETRKSSALKLQSTKVGSSCWDQYLGHSAQTQLYAGFFLKKYAGVMVL